LIDRRNVSVCLKHQGFEVDVILTANINELYQVWFGRIPLVEAIRKSLKSQARLRATTADMRGFSQWLPESRAALADRPQRLIGESR
jgi:hypothetical protein